MLQGDEIRVAVEAAIVGPRALARRAAVPGVAAVGRVIATGPGGAHLDGVRVAIGPHLGCGECDVCRRAGVVVCPVGRTLGVDAPGTVADEVVARARWALPLDGDLALPGPAAALIGYQASLAYALYARAGVGPREPTAIVGDGAIARLLVDVLIAKRAPPVVATDDAVLADWARGHGATAVARDAAALRDALGARPARLFACDDDDGGASLAFALAAAGPRATVAVAALGAVNGALGDALSREVTVIGVRGAHPDLFPEVAALAVRGEIDLAGAAQVIAPAELAAALDAPAGARALVVVR